MPFANKAVVDSLGQQERIGCRPDVSARFRKTKWRDESTRFYTTSTAATYGDEVEDNSVGNYDNKDTYDNKDE